MDLNPEQLAAAPQKRENGQSLLPPGSAAAKVLPWMVGISFFMQMLDNSILNTSLPSIAADFHTSPLQMQAVVIAYMLTVALFIPTSGWLTDHFGARAVFFTAIGVFTLGSLACALSPSLGFLVGSRVLQGVGGALMTPVGRLMVLRAFPRSQLVSVLSFITIPGLLGPLIGPTLGGLLSHYASWHWIFLINIPVGLLGMILCLRHLPRLAAAEDPGVFDWRGFLLFSVFMIALTLALDGMGELHLPPVAIILLALGGLTSLLFYWLHARKAAAPLFNPDLFAIRNFRIGILGNLFARLGNGALPFLTPLLLQVGLGYNPVKAGLTMLPMTLGAMIAKSLVSRLIKAAGYRRFLVCNTICMGLAIASFSLIGAETPYYCILALFTLMGMVNSMQFTSMNSLTLLDLPDNRAGSGNSLLSAIMQLAMGMGVACAASILNICSASGQEVIKGFQQTYIILGALGALASVIFLRAQDTQGYREKTRQ